MALMEMNVPTGGNSKEIAGSAAGSGEAYSAEKAKAVEDALRAADVPGESVQSDGGVPAADARVQASAQASTSTSSDIPSSAGTGAAAQAGAGASGPSLAGDVDVIEKEWVDKAEQIIQKFGTDPFHQEEAIEDLQIDYLKKRYGKNVKKSADSG